MAQLLLQLSKDNESPLVPNILFVIRTVMSSQHSTFELRTTQPRTLLFREQSLLQRFSVEWKFKVVQPQYLVIYLQPQFLYTFGTPLKVSNQRMLIDLLRVFTFKNTVNKWNIIVTGTNEVVLQYMCKTIETMRTFPATYALLRNEVKNIIHRLLIVLQPYTFQTIPVYQSENKQNQTYSSAVDSSAADEVFSALVMLQTRKKVRKSLEQAENNIIYSQAKTVQMKRQQVFNYLSSYRDKAFNQVLESVKILGSKSCFIENMSQQKLKRFEMNFKIWQQSTKVRWKGENKNVFGVKILNQIAQKDKRKASGTHCEVMMGRFQIVVMASLNSSTNEAFESIPGAQSLQYQKELELVKKKCKDRQRQPSLNSFYNELDFIEYIKDRNCKYVSTFYWQMLKKKAQMQYIIMDFYPHTLLSAQQSKSCNMSLQMKLTILMQVAQALALLADSQVCHRDIKPQNIMLDASRVPKIIDFGSCCPSYRAGSKQPFTVKDQRLLATPAYSKKYKQLPQNLKEKYSKRSYEQHILYDAFSFGKIMQEFLGDDMSKNLKIDNDFLQYLSQRCQQLMPQDRPTYQQVGFILFRMLQHLQKHYQSF